MKAFPSLLLNTAAATYACECVRLKRGGQCSPKLVCAEVRDWWRPVDALLYCSSQLRASSPELSSAPTMASFWERGAGCQQRPQGLFAPAPPQVRGLET